MPERGTDYYLRRSWRYALHYRRWIIRMHQGHQRTKDLPEDLHHGRSFRITLANV
jgi:hypothetical protein